MGCSCEKFAEICVTKISFLFLPVMSSRGGIALSVKLVLMDANLGCFPSLNHLFPVPGFVLGRSHIYIDQSWLSLPYKSRYEVSTAWSRMVSEKAISCMAQVCAEILKTVGNDLLFLFTSVFTSNWFCCMKVSTIVWS